jgi:hypothetical protein
MVASSWKPSPKSVPTKVKGKTPTAKVVMEPSLTSKELAENILGIHKMTPTPEATATTSPFKSPLTISVIYFPFLFITQHIVCLGNLFKVFLSYLGIFLILVRMILQSERPRRLLHLTLIGSFIQAKILVVAVRSKIFISRHGLGAISLGFFVTLYAPDIVVT